MKRAGGSTLARDSIPAPLRRIAKLIAVGRFLRAPLQVKSDDDAAWSPHGRHRRPTAFREEDDLDVLSSSFISKGEQVVPTDILKFDDIARTAL